MHGVRSAFRTKLGHGRETSPNSNRKPLFTMTLAGAVLWRRRESNPPTTGHVSLYYFVSCCFIRYAFIFPHLSYKLLFFVRHSIRVLTSC